MIIVDESKSPRGSKRFTVKGAGKRLLNAFGLCLFQRGGFSALMRSTFTRKCLFAALALGVIVFLCYAFHRNRCKCMFDVRSTTLQTATDQQISGLDGRSRNQPPKDGLLIQTEMERAKKNQEIEEILAKLDRMMPNVTFMHINTTTSAKNSKATILNHKDSYCVGEHLMVRLDMYDHSGHQKKYGGDFLRARIYSLDLKAGASGSIKDFKNGTYLVNFTLFWEGNVSASILLIHPSEGVSALWAARKKGYSKIGFIGKFLNGTSEVTTECGFNLNRIGELCEYLDERDQEAFYCFKPKHVPCEAFVHLKSYNKPVSYLTTLEQSLFKRSNIGVEIPQMTGEIHVVQCEGNQTKASKKCRLERNPTFPSGFVWQNQWRPLFCNLSMFNTLEQIQTCLKGKLVYFMGDSTVRQWMENLKKRVASLTYLDVHVGEKPQKLIAVSTAQNIQIHWKKHGHPYIGSLEYTVKDHSYIARDIDNIAGDKNTVLVISLGQHFRPFPIEFFVQRMINVRHAIRRLLLRSPGTRVIVKGENIREMDINQERFSDFHGYAQYLAVKNVFWDLKVAFLDAWDMTVAYNTKDVHPPDAVVWNEINVVLNSVC